MSWMAERVEWATRHASGSFHEIGALILHFDFKLDLKHYMRQRMPLGINKLNCAF